MRCVVVILTLVLSITHLDALAMVRKSTEKFVKKSPSTGDLNQWMAAATIAQSDAQKEQKEPQSFQPELRASPTPIVVTDKDGKRTLGVARCPSPTHAQGGGDTNQKVLRKLIKVKDRLTEIQESTDAVEAVVKEELSPRTQRLVGHYEASVKNTQLVVGKLEQFNKALSLQGNAITHIGAVVAELNKQFELQLAPVTVRLIELTCAQKNMAALFAELKEQTLSMQADQILLTEKVNQLVGNAVVQTNSLTKVSEKINHFVRVVDNALKAEATQQQQTAPATTHGTVGTSS
jgi:hypothetical protein